MTGGTAVLHWGSRDAGKNETSDESLIVEVRSKENYSLTYIQKKVRKSK